MVRILHDQTSTEKAIFNRKPRNCPQSLPMFCSTQAHECTQVSICLHLHTYILYYSSSWRTSSAVFFSGMRLIKTDHFDLEPASIQPADWRRHKPCPRRVDPAVFPTQSQVTQRARPLRQAMLTDCAVSWVRVCGERIGVAQVWCTYLRPHTLHNLFMCVFLPGSCLEQGSAIECNWAKLPLIRWIEKRPVSQKGTSILQNSSPFLPP